jgi:hypothetical protein
MECMTICHPLLQLEGILKGLAFLALGMTKCQSSPETILGLEERVIRPHAYHEMEEWYFQISHVWMKQILSKNPF